MKDEYLLACLQDYTKLKDEIHQLKKKNAALRTDLEQKQAIIRGLKRTAEIDDECRKQRLNLTTLQTAFKCIGGDKKWGPKHLKSIAAKSAKRPAFFPPSPSRPNSISFREDGGAASLKMVRSNAGSGAGPPPKPPPTTSPALPTTHKERGREPAAKGPIHHQNGVGSQPAPPAPSPRKKKGKRHQQQQPQPQQHRPHRPQTPHVELCLTLLKSGECPGCPRTHDPKQYPSWTKGCQSGFRRKGERDHNPRMEFGGSVGLGTTTVTITGEGLTGSPTQKRVRFHPGKGLALNER
ncbi:hypothetical protein TWF718_006493 [Orbilia javanica]|uniref:Uncharacterized protein n=1 Tax=Orbilia javanica TaxID=47235 RepID=A0AAN8N3Q1_9PEZI